MRTNNKRPVKNGASVARLSANAGKLNKKLTIPNGKAFSGTGDSDARITAVAFSDDAGEVVWGQSDGTIRFFDLQKQSLLATRVWHGDGISEIRVDGNHAYSLDKKSKARTWSLKSHDVLEEPESIRKFAIFDAKSDISVETLSRIVRIRWKTHWFDISRRFYSSNRDTAYLDQSANHVLFYDSNRIRRLRITQLLSSIEPRKTILVPGSHVRPIGMEFLSNKERLVIA